MTQKQEQNPIVGKIRRLMALSQSSNQHEAALAVQRYQDLLLEHNLSVAEVEASAVKNGNTDTGKREKSAHTGAAMYQYQRDLMEALSQNNFCMYWIEEQWRPDPKGSKPRSCYAHKTCDGKNDNEMGRIVKTHILLGRDDNVIITQMMYDYLVETMDRLLPWQGMEKRGKNALLWLAGCTETLVERLNEQRRQKERETRKRQEEAAARGETGLVRLSDLYNVESELNEDAKWGYEPGTTTRQRLEREARYRLERQKEEDLIAQGVDKHDAWYIARGMTPPEPSTPQVEGEVETEAQRRKREAKEQREQDRSDQRWYARRNKESRKRNDPAFRGGIEKGREIGLNQQVADNQKKRIG